MSSRNHDKLKQELTTTITEAVSTSLATKISELEDLFDKEPDGINPRLGAVKTEVEKIRDIVGPNPEIPRAASLQEELTTLRSDLNNLKNSGLPTDNSDLNELKCDFEAKTLEFEYKFAQYNAAVGVIKRKLAEHESKITYNTAKSFSNNVKIGGLFETEDEDPVNVVDTFLENILGITTTDGDIIEASRMSGVKRIKVGAVFRDLPKLMYVRCSPKLRQLLDQKNRSYKEKIAL